MAIQYVRILMHGLHSELPASPNYIWYVISADIALPAEDFALNSYVGTVNYLFSVFFHTLVLVVKRGC